MTYTYEATVQYEHDSADLDTIYLQLAPPGRGPNEANWNPCLRDIREGQRVLVCEFTMPGNPPPGAGLPIAPPGLLWLKDRQGIRRVQPGEPVPNPNRRSLITPVIQPEQLTGTATPGRAVTQISIGSQPPTRR